MVVDRVACLNATGADAFNTRRDILARRNIREYATMDYNVWRNMVSWLENISPCLAVLTEQGHTHRIGSWIERERGGESRLRVIAEIEKTLAPTGTVRTIHSANGIFTIALLSVSNRY